MVLHDHPCQCLLVLLGEFLAGHTQEWDCRVEGGINLQNFSRGCHIAPHWFIHSSLQWNPWRLVKTGFLGMPGPKPDLQGRLSGCGVLFHQAPQCFLDLHLEVPLPALPHTHYVTLGESLDLSELGCLPL